MTSGKIIVGIIAIIIGFALFLTNHIVGFIYGLVLIAIGIAIIIFHDSDKKIEQRKDQKGGKNKW